MSSQLGFASRVWGVLLILGMMAAPVRGQEVAGVSSYSYISGDEGWSSGGAAPIFPSPDFGVEFNQLTIGVTEFFNFGFWQSPSGAIPEAGGDDLFAVRALLSTAIEPCEVPTLRVRALAQGFAQSSLLTINSAGDCSAVPGDATGLFTSFFQPQGPAVDDDFIVAVDLLNFDPFDAATGDIIIDHVDILRISVATLGSPSAERAYTFEADQEGWASGAAPSVFDPPEFQYTGSALSIKSLNNIGTFGFWNNQAGDMTIAADKLYRARYDYTSTSNTPLSDQNASFRSRLYSSDNQWIQTTEHRLPNVGVGSYVAWFMPPASLVGSTQDGLGAAFDLTNFNPFAPTEVTLVVDEVAVESFDFPSGFKLLPFVPTEDTTIPGGEYDYSEIIIPPGVEVTVEDDVILNVQGDVDIQGILTGDCKRIEIYSEGDVMITGTVANTCSTTPTLDADIIIHTNGGDLILGTDTEPAEILSDGDVDITNDPSIADWQFLVPEGAESLVPLPPVVAATASTLYDAATTTFTSEIQFSGFGADPDGGPVTFAWDFGDGDTSTEQNPIHIYDSPGKHVVTLTVTDDEAETAQATITVVLSDDANIPTDPGVQIDPYFIVFEAGEEALFTAEAIDPDGQDLAYELTLGDLTTSTDDITTHVYALPGRYDLSLSVTDTSGTVSMATASVYVHGPIILPPARQGPPADEPEIRFNITTDPIKSLGPNAQIIGRQQIPPPHPKAPVGQAGKNMNLRGRGNAIVPAGSTVKAGDGGDGRNRNGQNVTAGNGRKGGSVKILVNGSLTVFGGTTISAGNGGNGGTATAVAPVNGSGSAKGGDGGNAGDHVWLQASRGVSFAGPGGITINPGSGGAGGPGNCTGTSALVRCNRGENGGRTWARGGNGGHASKTVVVGGNVTGLALVTLVGGNGGAGANGDAISGNGGTAAVCDPSAFGGNGGGAISYGGRGGNGRLTGAFGAVGAVALGAFVGGDGGNGNSEGGDGGDAEAMTDCALARAEGGDGGNGTASGGKGGRGFRVDGNGGNADAESGFGGNAKATGKQCGDDGADALANGGDAGSSRASRGDKGGSRGADGLATSIGGDGGNAEATGGDGKDKEDAPGGKGGAATTNGGKGGSANASRGVSIAGDGGDATSTGGKGGDSVSSLPDPCEDKTGLLGGPGGAATARAGNGGPAGGFQATDIDGFGGDAEANGGAGGDGLAGGGDCDQCGGKGGDASSEGGPGANASAFKGKKGGSNGSDGSAVATGGRGGYSFALAGKGGDCDDGSLGGPGGAATVQGGKGGNASGDDEANGGEGGSADSLGGNGGNSTNPPPAPCESQEAFGGPGGDGTATGGMGGTATGGAPSKTDGNGGSSSGNGGTGGLADANGGDCPGCGSKGGNGDSTGGNGGEGKATKGLKGGSNGGAVDGNSNAIGGTGGAALAKGGKGGDCNECPGGDGGPGGDVTGIGGDGGNANGDDTTQGGASGSIDITGGNGGTGASCCEPKPGEPGGDGGDGGAATATPGTPGVDPPGADGPVGVKAGDGGNGGDGEGPGAGGGAGVGTNVPSGSPGDPGSNCPRTVITPSHSTLPPGPQIPNVTSPLTGPGSDGNTYSPIGCTFFAPPPDNTNQPSYVHDDENGLMLFQPGSEDPLSVPAAVQYDVGALEVMVIGCEFDVFTPVETGFPGNCIQIIGYVNDVPVQQVQNLPTTSQEITLVLPPPTPGDSYNKIQINTYAVPTQFSTTTGVRIIDP